MHASRSSNRPCPPTVVYKGKLFEKIVTRMASKLKVKSYHIIAIYCGSCFLEVTQFMYPTYGMVASRHQQWLGGYYVALSGGCMQAIKSVGRGKTQENYSGHRPDWMRREVLRQRCVKLQWEDEGPVCLPSHETKGIWGNLGLAP